METRSRARKKREGMSQLMEAANGETKIPSPPTSVASSSSGAILESDEYVVTDSEEESSNDQSSKSPDVVDLTDLDDEPAVESPVVEPPLEMSDQNRSSTIEHNDEQVPMANQGQREAILTHIDEQVKMAKEKQVPSPPSSVESSSSKKFVETDKDAVTDNKHEYDEDKNLPSSSPLEGELLNPADEPFPPSPLTEQVLSTEKGQNQASFTPNDELMKLTYEGQRLATLTPFNEPDKNDSVSIHEMVRVEMSDLDTDQTFDMPLNRPETVADREQALNEPIDKHQEKSQVQDHRQAPPQLLFQGRCPAPPQLQCHPRAPPQLSFLGLRQVPPQFLFRRHPQVANRFQSLGHFQGKLLTHSQAPTQDGVQVPPVDQATLQDSHQKQDQVLSQGQVTEDGPLCLRWNEFSEHLVPTFKRLRTNDEFKDVTLACKEGFHKAHRMILCACSPYFASLLEYNVSKNPILFLKNVPLKHIEVILDYMYAGMVEVPEANLDDFLSTARRLKVRGLTNVKLAPDFTESKMNKTDGKSS